MHFVLSWFRDYITKTNPRSLTAFAAESQLLPSTHLTMTPELLNWITSSFEKTTGPGRSLLLLSLRDDPNEITEYVKDNLGDWAQSAKQPVPVGDPGIVTLHLLRHFAEEMKGLPFPVEA